MTFKEQVSAKTGSWSPEELDSAYWPFKNKEDLDRYKVKRSIFEENVLAKIDNEETLSEDEIKELASGGYQADLIEGEERRFHVDMTTIVELKGRFFRVPWNRGLTENHDDMYFEALPIEVVKTEREKLIKIVEWTPKGELPND